MSNPVNKSVIANPGAADQAGGRSRPGRGGRADPGQTVDDGPAQGQSRAAAPRRSARPGWRA
ncbi:hypothetical protein VF10_34835, partial [Nostoc linckia z13]